MDRIKSDFGLGLRVIGGARAMNGHHVSWQDAIDVVRSHGYFLGQGTCTHDAAVFGSAPLQRHIHAVCKNESADKRKIVRRPAYPGEIANLIRVSRI